MYICEWNANLQIINLFMKIHLITVNDYFYFLNKLQTKTFSYKQDLSLSNAVFEIAGNEEYFWIIELIFQNREIIENFKVQIWIFERIDDYNINVSIQDESENLLFKFKSSNINLTIDGVGFILIGNIIYHNKEFDVVR